MSPDPSSLSQSDLVRVGFDLGPWASPEEPGWRRAYDEVLAELAAAGRTPYAVLEPGLAPTPLDERLAGADPLAAEGWLEGYVAHAGAVIDRYAGQVAAFEVLPQPATTLARGPRVRPQWLAKALTDLAGLVRPAGQAARSRLVASLPDGPQGGPDYLQALFAAGRAGHGWDALAAGGRLPLDGVALALALDTGGGAASSAAGSGAPLAALAEAWARIEGPTAAGKPVFVSGYVLTGAPDPAALDAAVAAAEAAIGADPRVYLAARSASALWPVALPDPDAPASRDAAPPPGPLDPTTVFIAAETEAPSRGIARGEPPTVDGFDYPCGRRDAAEPWEDYYVAADVCDAEYHRLFKGVWHPGEDWNGKAGGDRDLGHPIYAIAHGVVTVAKYYPTSWGNVVLLRHAMPDGSLVWSQYAHLDQMHVAEGDVVSRGQPVGTLGKGAKNRWPAHLHFEVRISDVSAGNWFPMVRDRDKVLAHYAVAKDFIAQRRPGQLPSAGGPSVIVDEVDAGFSKADVPNWSAVGAGYGGGAWYTLGARRTAANVATWTATLPEPGTYQVAVFVPRVHATTENAVYTVLHAGGEASARVNQNRFYDQWVPVGSFPFEARAEVRLTDVTGEADAWKREVAFDAVRWMKLGA
jgi:murein DD-endopeptidase MepM/ murein hydrolase activator NlpD